MKLERREMELGVPTQAGGAAVEAIRNRVGPVRKVFSGIVISGAAARTLGRLEEEQIAAEAKIARTTIALATTKITSALVARSMPAIGSLTTTLNCATSAVDASLTSGCAADIASHIGVRHENRSALAALREAGRVDAEEAAVLTACLDEELADNIERARARTRSAKTAVSQLHECAVSGLASAEKTISKLS